MRGRKGKPTALKEAEGNPGKRKLSTVDLSSSPAIPKCPSWLDPAARAIWREQAAALFKLGIIRHVDQIVLANLCDSVATLKSAKKRLARARAEYRNAGKDPDEVLVYKTPGGCYIQNPLIGIINREKLNVQRMASEFGMTPAARARLMVDDGIPPNDPDADYESSLDAPRGGFDDDELVM
jgi:P27 family predicted phage terminase small subunit